jgi:hypothetical protein
MGRGMVPSLMMDRGMGTGNRLMEKVLDSVLEGDSMKSQMVI